MRTSFRTWIPVSSFMTTIDGFECWYPSEIQNRNSSEVSRSRRWGWWQLRLCWWQLKLCWLQPQEVDNKAYLNWLLKLTIPTHGSSRCQCLNAKWPCCNLSSKFASTLLFKSVILCQIDHFATKFVYGTNELMSIYVLKDQRSRNLKITPYKVKSPYPSGTKDPSVT